MAVDITKYKRTAPVPKTLRKARSVDINFPKKFSDKKKEIFYRELAMLLNSGVDFKKTLEIVSQQLDKKFEKDIVLTIRENIIKGKSICEAMMESGHFSPYEYFSVQIGEETRKLEEVLIELQKFFARKIQMRRQVISVLTYPAIVMLVTMLVLFFMLDKVVPMFSSVFRQFGSELPKSTRIILSLSRHSGTVLLGISLVFFTVTVLHLMYGKTKAYRRFTSSVFLKVPYFGKLIGKIYLSRFCQSMKLLLASRTTLISSLSLTEKMIGFYPIEVTLPGIREKIIKGATLSESLRAYEIFDRKLVSMLEVAEQVNQLDLMFERVTEQYNEEISHQTKMIGVILEPMIIILIGAIVGIIMVSMYAPMFDLSKIIKA